jgi:hypothetical protein
MVHPLPSGGKTPYAASFFGRRSTLFFHNVPSGFFFASEMAARSSCLLNLRETAVLAVHLRLKRFFRLLFLLFFFLSPQPEKQMKMSPLSFLVHYMDLKHFLLWIFVPLIGVVARWGARTLVGAVNHDGEFSSSLRALHSSSTYFHLLDE